MAWISLNKGFILNETYFSEKNIFLFFLPYGPNFFLCIFNQLIRNFSTCFRTIAAESICLYSLLSWFVSLFNKTSAVFNGHMCNSYKFQSNYTLQEGLIYLFVNISQDNSMEPQIPDKSSNPTRMIHEFDLLERLTRMTHEFHPRKWPTRMIHEFHPREWPTRPTWPTRFITLFFCGVIPQKMMRRTITKRTKSNSVNFLSHFSEKLQHLTKKSMLSVAPFILT